MTIHNDKWFYRENALITAASFECLARDWNPSSNTKPVVAHFCDIGYWQKVIEIRDSNAGDTSLAIWQCLNQYEVCEVILSERQTLKRNKDIKLTKLLNWLIKFVFFWLLIF